MSKKKRKTYSAEFKMEAGDNRSLILRKDPDWQLPGNAALNFIYHGTLVVEMVEIGDSRGVDIEIERDLISVVRSSVRTFSGIISWHSVTSLLMTGVHDPGACAGMSQIFREGCCHEKTHPIKAFVQAKTFAYAE